MQFSTLRWAGLATVLLGSTAIASTLEQVLDENISHSQAASASQNKIEQLDDATQNMLLEYRSALARTKTLESYNQQMRDLVESQQTELAGYQKQLQDLEETQTTVTPLMSRMLEVLEQFVAADLPFLPYERTERLESLNDLLPRADISLAEKYRRIVEAYQIESDYGRTLEVWRGYLSRGGQEISVDFLRLGRLMLYYQTPDGHETGWWSPQENQWLPLPSKARRPVSDAIAISRQQKSPDWLRLPVKTISMEAQQ